MATTLTTRRRRRPRQPAAATPAPRAAAAAAGRNWLGGAGRLVLAGRSCWCRSTGSSSPASRRRATTSRRTRSRRRPTRRSTTTGWSSSRTSPRYFVNSVIVTVGAIVPAVAALLHGGVRDRARRHAAGSCASINALFLMGLAIPLQATIIPVYLIIIRLHLYDSLLAIILPSIAFAIPLSVLVLTNFIRDVPKELFESMRLDGASEWSTLWRLAFPLTRPALVTVTHLQRPDDLERLPAAADPHPEPGPADAAAGAVDLPGPVQRQRAGRPRLGRPDHAADPGALRDRPPPAAQRPDRRLQQVTRLRRRRPSRRSAVRRPRPTPRPATLLAACTDAEKRLGLLDGDEPFWPGMPTMMGDGYNLEPIVAGAVPRLGIPGIRFSDGPRGAVIGRSTAFPVPMARGRHLGPGARGAGRRGDRRGDPRAGRQLLRRRLRQPAAPPGLGSRPGDVRRGTGAARRDRRRADPRRPAARDGVRQALRVQQHGERAVHGRRPGRRARRCTRSTCRTSAPSSRPASPRDERVQLGQRRVVRAEPRRC